MVDIFILLSFILHLLTWWLSRIHNDSSLRVEDSQMINSKPDFELDTKCMPVYNLPDVYSTTSSTVLSTANLQVVAACSMWFSVNTGSQSWGYWVDSVDIVFVGCCVWPPLVGYV